MIDGNDIWEALFGIMKGNVPEALTEDVLEQLAAALRPSPVLEVAKEALEPFAAADRWFAEDEDDSYSPPWAEFFRIVDFRRARAALQTLKEGMGSDVPKGLGDV